MLAVLPAGYGKSLIYQLLAPTYNFMDFAGSPGGKKSTVIVISPVNALIRDQIVKMREGGLNVSVLKAHLHPRLIAVVCFCFESLYCPNA